MQALGGGEGLGTPIPRLETMGAGGGAGERVVAGEAAQGRAAAPHGRRHPGSAPRPPRPPARSGLGRRRSEQEQAATEKGGDDESLAPRTRIFFF